MRVQMAADRDEFGALVRQPVFEPTRQRLSARWHGRPLGGELVRRELGGNISAEVTISS